jgi:hypothetical protein
MAKSYEKPYYLYMFRNQAYITKWPSASRQATFAGGWGHIFPAFGMTI